jgi:multiple sugar transport system permease protein
LHGTLQGLIIIYLSITIPIISWVLMGYFATLPIETERAARIDGCTRLQALRRVTIPMASAGIGTVGALTFLMSWNEFLFAWLLTAGTPAQTLPPVFPAMLFHIIDNTGLAAAAIISLIPPIIIALIFGRFIVRLRIVDPVTTMGQ